MALMRRFPVVGWLCSALLLSLPFGFVVATGETPVAVTPDGGRYYGALVDGKRQGEGRIGE
jgi:hypothetical protein